MALSNESRSSSVRYRSQTLHEDNRERRNFLPRFPPSREQARSSLLFPNVPVEWLSEDQRERRRPGTYRCPFTFTKNPRSKVPSFLNFLHQNLIVNTSEKFQVDPSIIDYNLTILDECITVLVKKREVEFPNEEQPAHHRTFFHVQEWQWALEFFLQFDADVFFLKTCTFGDVTEGLFCVDPPKRRYRMASCDQLDCPCCPRAKLSDGCHRFANGYQAYLNGPANCQSSNLIYVFTCRCGQFDYVGATQATFRETFLCKSYMNTSMLNGSVDYHRQSCRDRTADGMRLFQHLRQCLIAIQLCVNSPLDMFDLTILAILPERCPVLLRRLVESLFITHAECKLNETGHLIDLKRFLRE